MKIFRGVKCTKCAKYTRKIFAPVLMCLILSQGIFQDAFAFKLSDITDKLPWSDAAKQKRLQKQQEEVGS